MLCARRTPDLTPQAARTFRDNAATKNAAWHTATSHRAMNDKYFRDAEVETTALLYKWGLAGNGNKRILEIGCGTGRMTLALARTFEPVDAVDISPAMLQCAETRPHLTPGRRGQTAPVRRRPVAAS